MFWRILAPPISVAMTTQVNILLRTVANLSAREQMVRRMTDSLDAALREVNAALLRRSLPHLLWGTLFDRPPSAALEHILSGVGQSLGLREQEALIEQARRESGGYGVASQVNP